MGSSFASVKDFGAKGDGLTDDSGAFSTALATGQIIYVPAGTYNISSTITIPVTASLIGAGPSNTILRYTGNEAAIVMGSTTVNGFPVTVAGKVSSFKIVGKGSNAVGTVGIKIAKALFAIVENVTVNDMETGFLLDGMDLWCASCNLYHPITNRVKFGLKLTANSGKQVNHTNVFSGYFYGESPVLKGSHGVLVEQGDTNTFHGTAVEDFDYGFRVTSQYGTGQRFYAPRTEGITPGHEILIDSGSIGNILLGVSDDVTFNGGSIGSNSVISDKGTFPKVATLPSVGSWNRRQIIRTEGDTGVADNIYLARKKADETYEWASLVNGSSSTIDELNGSILRSPSGIPFKPVISDTGTVIWSFSGLAYDLFDRPNNTASLGSANMGGAWTAVYGRWGIISNECYSVSDAQGDLAVLPNLGTGDYSVSCNLLGTINNNSKYREPQLLFRYLDSNNFLKIYFQGGNLYLDSQDNGNLASAAFTGTDGVYYTVKAVCKNKLIQVYVNGVLKITYTMTSTEYTKYGSAGIVGLRLSKAGSPTTLARFNNFIVESY